MAKLSLNRTEIIGNLARDGELSQKLADIGPHEVPSGVVERYWKFVTRGANADDCWTWNGSAARGYGQVSRGRGLSPYKAHRISWAIHHNGGSLPRHSEHVLHSCDNPPCTNPLHLHLGDPSLNATERQERGREAPGWMKARPGELNGFAKLTWEKVREIRARPPSVSSATLAQEFGVHITLIRRIRANKSWKEVAA